MSLLGLNKYTSPAFGRAGGTATETRSLLLNSLTASSTDNWLCFLKLTKEISTLSSITLSIRDIFTHLMQLEDHETPLNAGRESRDLLYSVREIFPSSPQVIVQSAKFLHIQCSWKTTRPRSMQVENHEIYYIPSAKYFRPVRKPSHRPVRKIDTAVFSNLK